MTETPAPTETSRNTDPDKRPARSLEINKKRLGVLLGGAGLIGGTVLHYFKTKVPGIEILAPNSKRVSLREPGDIRDYFRKFAPDFIINAAIATIDSSAKISYDVNYMGTVHLAQMAAALRIPYIHLSSAATLPPGTNLTEEDALPLSPDLAHYPKSKLMAEKTVEYLHEAQGLDHTTIRLAVVYGQHDHKIQGFHRLLFMVVSGKLPFLMTRKGVFHTYSNAAKLPYFIHHTLEHRAEFSGQTYHFVDNEPVELVRIIRQIKETLRIDRPREIYIPYPLAKFGGYLIRRIIKGLGRIGIDAKLPGELLFLREFYRTQTLSAEKLALSSFRDPAPQETVFTELPFLLEYYLTRWGHFNLISPYDQLAIPTAGIAQFIESPASLLDTIHERIRTDEEAGMPRDG